MRKPTAPDQEPEEQQRCTLASLDTKMFHDCPSLMAALATVRYTDGSPRENGWFMVRMQGTLYQVILKDPSTGMELQGVGPTVDDAFAAVELMLGMDRPPWQLDKYARAREPRKKGK